MSRDVHRARVPKHRSKSQGSCLRLLPSEGTRLAKDVVCYWVFFYACCGASNSFFSSTNGYNDPFLFRLHLCFAWFLIQDQRLGVFLGSSCSICGLFGWCRVWIVIISHTGQLYKISLKICTWQELLHSLTKSSKCEQSGGCNVDILHVNIAHARTRIATKPWQQVSNFLFAFSLLLPLLAWLVPVSAFWLMPSWSTFLTSWKPIHNQINKIVIFLH